MRRILLGGLAPLAILVFAACSGGASEPASAPVQDVPRMGQYEVWGQLRMHVNMLRHKSDHTAMVGCAAEEARYQGSGLWHCGRWVFNERTGAVASDDGRLLSPGSHIH